jgi:hypothetical protein
MQNVNFAKIYIKKNYKTIIKNPFLFNSSTVHLFKLKLLAKTNLLKLSKSKSLKEQNIFVKFHFRKYFCQFLLKLEETYKSIVRGQGAS